MRCRQVRKLLIEEEVVGLSGAQKEVIDEHLEGCPDCAAVGEKLSLSRGALSTLVPVNLPQEASARILATVRAEAKPASGTSKAIGFFYSTRGLALAAGVAALLVALVVVVGVTVPGPGVRQGGETLNKERAAEQEYKDKGSAPIVTEGAIPSGMLPIQPVVNVTANDYSPDSLRQMFDNLDIRKEFTQNYTMGDAVTLGPLFATRVAEEFTKNSLDGALLERMITYLQSGEAVLLPCYVEVARFNGRSCWIILLAGPPRSGDSTKLTRTEAWVMDPTVFPANPDGSIIFFLGQR